MKIASIAFNNKKWDRAEIAYKNAFAVSILRQDKAALDGIAKVKDSIEKMPAPANSCAKTALDDGRRTLKLKASWNNTNGLREKAKPLRGEIQDTRGSCKTPSNMRQAGMPALFFKHSATRFTRAPQDIKLDYILMDMKTGEHNKLGDIPADLLENPEYTQTTIVLRRIPGGEFKMGSPESESEDEKQHGVRLTKDFHIGVFEVTQGQWEAVMDSNPSEFKNAGKAAPVENVSWDDCQEFIQKLNAASGLSFRLPTEAEWEYACRAGTTTSYNTGDEDWDLAEAGWHEKNSGGTTHPVGQKKPNAWGLYDMHGNVWERCQDWYGDYSMDSVTDPTGPSSGSYRVLRGGGWYFNAAYCRSAYRSYNSPDNQNNNYGFRLVLPADR